MREMLVKENDANQRLDKFISKAVPLLPKALMYKYIRNKKIKVNRKRCEINQRLAVGDVVTYYMAEEFFSSSVDLNFLACTLTPRVIYEDEMILVLYKPAGVSIHADEKFPVENLVNAMKKYLYKKKDYEPESEHSFSPSVVNRLDRNTEGLVLAAKTYEALKDLNEMVKMHQIQKRYLAVVSGKLSPKQAHLVAYHQKDSEENKAVVSLTPREGYKEMITNYKVL
ncbi:MAG: pseudouridine synthase, partial [Erysipelotrichaceae bacterium]